MKCWRLRKKTIYRTFLLILAAFGGVGLAFCIYPVYIYDLINFYSSTNNILHSSMTILALGLFIFYVLWVFRTHDVQEQIDKTEENTNNSTFFECARMLTEVKLAEGEPAGYDSLSKKTALEQLAYLRRETGFDKKRIDSLTRGLGLGGKNFNLARFNGLDLSKAYLSRAELNGADLTLAILNRAKLNGAELNGANLSGANLTEAILDGAISPNVPSNMSGSNIATNLTGAKLNGADLTEAKLNKAILIDAELIGAKLNEANLSGANLTKADLNDANLTGAIYDSKTKFIGTILESQEMRNKAGMEHNADL